MNRWNCCVVFPISRYVFLFHSKYLISYWNLLGTVLLLTLPTSFCQFSILLFHPKVLICTFPVLETSFFFKKSRLLLRLSYLITGISGAYFLHKTTYASAAPNFFWEHCYVKFCKSLKMHFLKVNVSRAYLIMIFF